jgi:hypothetical protein
MSPLAWLKWGVALLLIAALAGCIYNYGEIAERVAWLARDIVGLTAANAKIKSLEEQYRKQEHDHADALAAISSQYQKDLKHVKDEKDRVIAGLRDGSMRLLIPVATTFKPDGSAACQITTTATGRDGQTRAELSVSASEFLVSFAAEADEVSKQLGRCQDIINADRGEGNARK